MSLITRAIYHGSVREFHGMVFDVVPDPDSSGRFVLSEVLYGVCEAGDRRVVLRNVRPRSFEVCLVGDDSAV